MAIPYSPGIPTPSPHPGIPYPWKGPGTRNTLPLPPEGTWYQGYPTPREDLVPGIPNTPPPGNRQTPVKTLPSLNFIGGH